VRAEAGVFPCAVVADTRASLVTAGLGYLLFDGFLVNRFGDRTWDGTTIMWHLTVLPSRWAAASCCGGLATPWPARPRMKYSTRARRSRTVADIALVLLTVGLFAVLALVVRAVERLCTPST
jgi:hypothetical protein